MQRAHLDLAVLDPQAFDIHKLFRILKTKSWSYFIY